MTLEKAARVYLDYKQKSEGLISLLMSLSAIITAAALTRVETDFLELAVFIDAGMPLCHYADTEVYRWSFHPNSQDLCVSLANRCPENAESVSTL